MGNVLRQIREYLLVFVPQVSVRICELAQMSQSCYKISAVTREIVGFEGGKSVDNPGMAG